MLATPCCTTTLIKDLYILLYSYYFTLTVTLSIHGNSNMEVLTSNVRMSATTIFSLFFNLDENVLGHLCEEGLTHREDIKIPFHVIFSFLTILLFLYRVHLNAHFYFFGFIIRILPWTYEFLSDIYCILLYWYFIL